MSRTIGTMKVAVFEEQAKTGGDRETMLALANLFSEAASWLRDETCRKIPGGGKNGQFHRLYNFAAHIAINNDDDLDGAVVQLYVHYDDNEKG